MRKTNNSNDRSRSLRDDKQKDRQRRSWISSQFSSVQFSVFSFQFSVFSLPGFSFSVFCCLGDQGARLGWFAEAFECGVGEAVEALPVLATYRSHDEGR